MGATEEYKSRNRSAELARPGRVSAKARLKTRTRVRVLASHTKQEEGTRVSGVEKKKPRRGRARENGERDVKFHSLSNAALITFPPFNFSLERL